MRPVSALLSRCTSFKAELTMTSLLCFSFSFHSDAHIEYTFDELADSDLISDPPLMTSTA
ncbi:hypothetical protein I7I48_09245 [Histoplasma ohiense]|nr:hypothetical protein I7I48_09245 [Histoplasma ohiense (nom. inval.)]